MLVIKKNTIWNPKIITPVLVKFLLFILLISSFTGSALAQNPNPNSSLDAAIASIRFLSSISSSVSMIRFATGSSAALSAFSISFRVLC